MENHFENKKTRLKELLDVVIVGSRGSGKDYEGMVKSLVPPKQKIMTKDIAKQLQKKVKKPKG